MFLFVLCCTSIWVSHPGFPDGAVVKNLPASAGNARDLGSMPGSGRSLEKEMTAHSSILACKIPWSEKPVKLQSIGSQRVRHDWAYTHTHTHTYIHQHMMYSECSIDVCWMRGWKAEWMDLSVYTNPWLPQTKVLWNICLELILSVRGSDVHWPLYLISAPEFQSHFETFAQVFHSSGDLVLKLPVHPLFQAVQKFPGSGQTLFKQQDHSIYILVKHTLPPSVFNHSRDYTNHWQTPWRVWSS